MLDFSLWLARFQEGMLLRHWSGRTVRSYAYELVRFFDFLKVEGVLAVSDVTREVLEDYRRAVFEARVDGRPTTARTQAARLIAVKAFLRLMARQGYLLVDAGLGLELPRGPRTLPRTLLTEAETERVLLAPDTGTVLGLRNRAILELLYATAIRNAELRALDVTDVHVEALEVHVRLGKHARGRYVPMGREARRWVMAYLEAVRPVLLRRPEERALFLSEKHGRLSAPQLGALVAEAGEQAGLPKRVTPHVLRNACATHMLARGAGIRHLQELLGHASLETTQRYTRIELSGLRAVHRRFHPRERHDG